ncbi:MAG: hypothetical protein EA359_19550 [Balneolaceae bacterium]|nr:MAG: hypothetical protein EA359_19550 [Balneolaceae bacterium]
MNKISGLIAGDEIYQTELIKIKENKDYRGSFSEIFQEYWGTCIKPVQWSVVKSEKNVFRGMHLHKRHDEYFCLLTGHCLVGLKDIRPGSPTEGYMSLYELFEEDMAAITFPKGLLHGWYFIEPSIHLQSVSEAYADYGKDDNWGVVWNAPDLGIPWPVSEVILSERAQDFPTLAGLKASLGAWQPFEKSLSEPR